MVHFLMHVGPTTKPENFEIMTGFAIKAHYNEVYGSIFDVGTTFPMHLPSLVVHMHKT